MVPRRRGDDRRFWFRFALTTVLVALPLAYGQVVYGVSPVATFVGALVAAVALLAIWDASRLIPSGWMFWNRPEAIQDADTGVFNPGGWERHLEMEEDRCRRHGLEAAVVMIRLDGVASDPSQVGARISGACRVHDIVACLDEQTYGVLAIATDSTRSNALLRRIEETCRDGGVTVTVSAADRATHGTLLAAWAAASADRS